MTRSALTLRTSLRALAVATLMLTPTLVYAQAAPAPYMSAVRYDAANRPTGTIAPDPDGTGPLKFAATRTTYDASGRVTKVETGQLSVWKPDNIAPSNWGADFEILSSVETAYDTLDRKIQELGKGSVAAGSPTVSATQYSYDGMGRLDCSATRMNLAAIPVLGSNACTLGTAGSFGNDRITQNVYNSVSQLLVVKKAVGTPRQQDYVTYTYTPNGKQATVKDANGNLASMTYDGHDRQTHWTFPSKTTAGQLNTADYEQYAYDANGNRTSLRKRDGSVLTYSYDNLNRMTVKVVPERAGLATTHTRDVYYGYDLRGLQLYARFDSASGEGVASSYDGFGRLASTSQTMDGTTRTLSYARNKNGNRTELTWMDGHVTGYRYDGLNRLDWITQGPVANAAVMLIYSYNKRGLVEFQNGRFSSARWYDAAGRLGSLQFEPVPYGPGHFLDYSFAYNPAQQIITRSTSNDAYVFTGDVNVNRNYQVNGLNQYTSAGPATFTYDANGNLTGDGTSGYVYDVENRLVSKSGGATATLRYDPLGRLYEVNGSTSGITRFLNDGDEMVAEYNGSGTLLRRYLHGINVDDPVVVYEGSGTAAPRWLHANHQGSIIGVSDNAGQMTHKNSYDEWGIPSASNATIAQGGRFAYTGQAWIPELGMYHYKARIYSPTLGRFMQTDPVGYKDQMNLYGYVGNDPANGVDSTGMIGSLVRDHQADKWNRDFNRLSAADKSSLRDRARGELGINLGARGTVGSSWQLGPNNSEQNVTSMEYGHIDGIRTFGDRPRRIKRGIGTSREEHLFWSDVALITKVNNIPHPGPIILDPSTPATTALGWTIVRGPTQMVGIYQPTGLTLRSGINGFRMDLPAGTSFGYGIYDVIARFETVHYE